MPRIPRWLKRLLYANIGLIALIRIVLVFPLPGLEKLKGLRQFWGKTQFAEQLHQVIGNERLIMDNGFQDISNYNFTNNTTRGFSYNTRNYRKTQYDYWPIEDSLRNQSAYFASFKRHETKQQDSMATGRGMLYLMHIDSVRTYQKVSVSVKGIEKRVGAGTLQRINLEIHNPYNDTISFSNAGKKWDCFIEYGFTRYIFEQADFQEIPGDYRHIRIPPRASASLATTIRMPETPGDYRLVFSIRTTPFVGSRNSKKIPVSILSD